MKMLRKILLSIVVLFGCVSLAFAQKATIKASVKPADILIGEQAIVDIEVIVPKGRDVKFPMIQDTIVKGVEVLSMLPIDTVETEVWTLSQKYVITSFDSALYHIPYLPVIDGTDTLKTNDFGLKVTSPQLSEEILTYLDAVHKQGIDSLDFQKLGISDIKPILDAPFVWSDYLSYIIYSILALMLIGLLIALYLILTNKKKKGYYFTPKIKLPPHVVALDALDKLKERKLNEQGLDKEFHSAVSDIVRLYVKDRYGINATEMLTDEIIAQVKKQVESKSSDDSIEQILKLADLVKFAKFTPLRSESDLSLMNAYLFVNQTKEELPKETAETAAPLEEKDINNKNTDK